MGIRLNMKMSMEARVRTSMRAVVMNMNVVVDPRGNTKLRSRGGCQ